MRRVSHPSPAPKALPWGVAKMWQEYGVGMRSQKECICGAMIRSAVIESVSILAPSNGGLKTEKVDFHAAEFYDDFLLITWG